jgi:hypothetical protein
VHHDARRAEDVPGRQQPERHAAAERRAFVERHRLQQVQRALRIVERIERLRRMVLGIAVAVREVGFFLLQPRAVAQHDVAQFGRGRRAVHGPAKSFTCKHRKIAGVIDVRMREHDGVERVGRERQRPPVAQSQVLGALEQAAIDQDAPAAVLDQVFRAGHGFGRAEKSQFHEIASPGIDGSVRRLQRERAGAA